jgi:hypothetical protein
MEMVGHVSQIVVSGVRGAFGWVVGGGIAVFFSDIERMKNTTVHVCAKTAFVG